MNDLKDKLNALGEELRGLDPQKDAAVIRAIRQEIWITVFENRKYYYWSIVIKGGNQKVVDEPAFTDILNDLCTKKVVEFDPGTGRLSAFIRMHLDYRTRDYIRKITKTRKEKNAGKEANSEKEADTKKKPIQKELFLDKLINDSGNTTLIDKLQDSYDFSGNVIEGILFEEYIVQISSMIIHFTKNHDKNNKNMQIRRHYFELFYTEMIMNDIKSPNISFHYPYRHERDLISAIFLPYLNFMTEKTTYGDGVYPAISDVSFDEIVNHHLEFIQNVAPSDYIVKDDELDRELSIPLERYVLRGYFERVEHTPKTESAILSSRKKFKNEIFQLIQCES